MFLITFLFVCFNVCECLNLTEKYVSIGESSLYNKKGRLLTFHTQDDDIEVALEFAVPFIKIPVKKSLDMTGGALANVNLGGILLAGLTSFVIAVILPGLFSIFKKNLFALPDGNLGFFTNPHSSYKKSNPDSSEVWRYLTILDEVLMENNVDTTTCMQRMICWTVKKSSKSVSSGRGTSFDKILDGLATSEWLQDFISNTPFYSALRNGLENINCSKEYDKCKINQRAVNNFVKNIIKSINGG